MIRQESGQPSSAAAVLTARPSFQKRIPQPVARMRRPKREMSHVLWNSRARLGWLYSENLASNRPGTSGNSRRYMVWLTEARLSSSVIVKFSNISV